MFDDSGLAKAGAPNAELAALLKRSSELLQLDQKDKDRFVQSGLVKICGEVLAILSFPTANVPLVYDGAVLCVLEGACVDDLEKAATVLAGNLPLLLTTGCGFAIGARAELQLILPIRLAHEEASGLVGRLGRVASAAALMREELGRPSCRDDVQVRGSW